MASTREKILEAALELFSCNGYDATSMEDIARVVGVRKPSLYSHFAGKQAILDELMQRLTEQYERHNRFTDADPETHAPALEDLIKLVQQQLRFSLHDPDISRVRRLLTIEQFRSTRMAQEQERRTYTDIVRFYSGLMRQYILDGVLRKEDPEIMARQFLAPISMELFRCDRDPDLETQAMEIVERHIRQFMHIYGVHDET